MKCNRERTKDREGLRRRAERLLSCKAETEEETGADDTAKLVHEFRVHQIELEMQNEALRKAQAEIENSRSKYSDLYDFAPVGYFTFDRKGMILEANLAGAKLFGVERSLLLYLPFIHRFISPESRTTFRRHLERVFSTDTKEICELKLIKKGGNAFYVSLESISSKDSKGNRSQCRSVMSDITDRREAERALRESEQRYRQLAESAQDFIFIIDKESKVRYINSSGAKEFRCDPDQMLGKSIADLFSPDTAKRQWDKIQEVIQSGQALPNSETKIVFPTREVWLNTSLIPLQSESAEVNQVLGISRDVTERKQGEETLRESENRYRRISEENARLLEQARQDAQTKTTLLHEVNHRVKNNLASIIGLIQVQERFGKKKGSPEFPSVCRDLVGRVQGLAMAHNLLSASGWSWVKLTDLASEVVHSTLQIFNSGQRVSVRVLPSSIQVTPDQANTLALVINELATNTMKYGQAEKQTPSISVRVEENDGQIFFEFQDNGRGYPEPMLDEEQYDMGLHLVTNLVRRELRGEVTFHSENGAVTRIQFGHQRA